jgi:hypothetical protein
MTLVRTSTAIDAVGLHHGGIAIRADLGDLFERQADALRSGHAGRRHFSKKGLYAGTEVIEFSPTAQLQETLAVVEKNMADNT